MNILLTSAGRRGYLVEYFKYALHGEGEVHAANSSSIAPAFSYADKTVVTPLIYSEEYIPFLVSYCKKNYINLIIPLFDVDLMVLAKNKSKFEKIGAHVIVSDPDVIKICNDKWETYKFAKQQNVCAPKTYLELNEAIQELQEKKIKFPIIIKPRWGMGSLGVYEADNFLELEVFYKKCKKEISTTYMKYESMIDFEKSVLLQEKIDGQEYGIDVINDLCGEFCNAVVKKKYSMRAGETDCASVVDNPLVYEFARSLGKKMKHIANLDVDIFIKENTIYLLEMNARFGGGYPFSYISGVNLPEAIIKWKQGEAIDKQLEIKVYDRLIHKDIQFVDLSKI